MKLFKKMKDGGSESTVVGYWLIEAKRLFSICLLNFQGKSREAFHNHAFDAVSWVIKGELVETHFNDGRKITYKPSFKPIWTPKECFHKVDSVSDNAWVLTFRGPWVKTWNEYRPNTDEYVTLTEHRREI